MLNEYAAPMLRVELTNGSKWSHESPYRDAWMWDASTPDKLLEERLAVLEVSDTMRLADDTLQGLPPKLVPSYDAWRASRDLRLHYSKAHFYRLRRQLLNLANFDIGRVQPCLVVPDDEYLVGEPVGPILRRSWYANSCMGYRDRSSRFLALLVGRLESGKRRGA